MSNDTTKTCSKCGNVYPATTEYFRIDSQHKDGLSSWCRNCYREYDRKYKQANRDKLAEYNRKYKQVNKDKLQKYDYEYKRANRERISEYNRQYQQENKEKLQENYQINKDKRREYVRMYRTINPDKIREINRQYRQENKDKERIKSSRYRARKRQLPDTFTEAQWLACLEYFNHSCAVCGIEFGDTTPHADHWIPLNSDECTGTIASNMICLCSECNWNKNDKLPDTWLKEKYDTHKANEILNQVNTYFEWVVKDNSK